MPILHRIARLAQFFPDLQYGSYLRKRISDFVMLPVLSIRQLWNKHQLNHGAGVLKKWATRYPLWVAFSEIFSEAALSGANG